MIKNLIWNEFGNDLNQDFETNKRKFWSNIRTLRRKKKKVMAGMKDRDNEIKINTKEMLNT